MIRSCLEDLFRYEGAKCHSWFVQLRYILFTPCYRYTYIMRHAQEANNRIVCAFWFLMLKRCSFKFGIQIPYQTKIGRGFRIAHWGHIVVNPESTIGEDCTIAQGVLLGNAQGKHKGAPSIGNRCQIGANATVLGGVSLGDDVLVAPGAFVNFDVPSNSIVIGNPGKIIPRDSSPTAKYIVYSIKDYI